MLPFLTFLVLLRWRAAAFARAEPLAKRAKPFYASSTPAADGFSLATVRASLIRQEETIIFALIERAQFAANRDVYEPDAFTSEVSADLESQCTGGVAFLDMMLYETEQVHARARRYLSPEEHAFFPQSVCAPVLTPLSYPSIILDDGENINDQVRAAYLDHVVPRACAAGDDAQHGSTAICDISCLQALSRRIHFGKFVAESKLAEDSEAFRALAAAGDIEGINRILTNEAVEDSVVRRAQLKGVTFGQEAFSDKGPGYKVDPACVGALYRDMIIPLTKQVQVRYILHKLGHADKIPAEKSAWPAHLRAFQTDRRPAKAATADADY